MQVRRLSPSSLWLETPLSIQTPPLVWRAMAAAGLDRGKISSYSPIHFFPEFESHKHLIEGFTSSGLFRDNSRIIVELSPQDDGTRLDIDIERTDGGIDLTGRARTLKRQYIEDIEGFFADLPDQNEDEGAIHAPPIASPHAGGASVRFVEAQHGLVMPVYRPKRRSLRETFESFRNNWKQVLLRYAIGIAVFWLCQKFNLWGFLFLGLAAYEVWSSKKYRYKLHWFTFLFFLILGLARTWVFLHQWF